MRIKLSVLLPLLIACSATNILAQQNPIPNPGFETWIPFINYAPGWLGDIINKAMFKSSDAHTGSYALGGQVVTVSGTVTPPVILTQTLIPPVTGFPISYRPGSFEGYYKFTSVGGDMLSIALVLKKNGNPIGAAIPLVLSPTESYQLFTAPAFAAGTPDTAVITFTILNILNGGKTHIGSKFLIDDLTLPGTAGVTSQRTTSSLSLEQNFPNPFSSSSTVLFEVPKAAHVSLKLFNLTGDLVQTILDANVIAGQHSAQVNANGLAPGTYALCLFSPEGERLVRFLTIAK